MVVVEKKRIILTTDHLIHEECRYSMISAYIPAA
jgi:hypothetical protein